MQFSLKGRPGAITLEDEGLHHPASSRWGWPRYTPYAEITHLAASPRSLWLGTQRSVFVIPRRSFVEAEGPEHLVRALLERISQRPGGQAQLARMAQVEETARLPGEPRATRILVAVCALVYALQIFGGDAVWAVGHFRPGLFADGDWWRVITANLLHAFSLHLILNLLALWAVGSLVERVLGTARTVGVMVASGLASMLGSGLVTPVPVVGVSGVVSGLMGALVWLELRFPGELPAWWRVPRRAIYWVLGLSVALSLLPFVAGAAHGFGFGMGVVLAAGHSWGALRSRPSPWAVRTAAAAGAALCVLAGLAAAWEVRRDGHYVGRYALRIAPLDQIDPEELNNLAWMIAIDDRSSEPLLETALDLAERAVDETERRAPHMLDTLAEVHFRLGDADEALRVIDEAIRQDPDREYYREQRKRYTGEREGGPPQRRLASGALPGAPRARAPDRHLRLSRTEDRTRRSRTWRGPPRMARHEAGAVQGGVGSHCASHGALRLAALSSFRPSPGPSSDSIPPTAEVRRLKGDVRSSGGSGRELVAVAGDGDAALEVIVDLAGELHVEHRRLAQSDQHQAAHARPARQRPHLVELGQQGRLALQALRADVELEVAGLLGRGHEGGVVEQQVRSLGQLLEHVGAPAEAAHHRAAPAGFQAPGQARHRPRREGGPPAGRCPRPRR